MNVFDEKKWYAVYTKYKCEKLVCETLAKKDVEAYTPLLQKVKVYQRSKKTYHYPLIPNYSFVKISNSERLSVLQTNHVMGFLKIGSREISIPEKEINLLKRIVGENIDVEMIPNIKRVGEEVEIIHGALTGVKGKLVSIKNNKECIIQLQKIGMQLRIGVPTKFLRSLSPILV